MTIIIDRTNNPVKQESVGIKRDPLTAIPEELVLQIFSHLNLASLGASCQVRREWNRIAKDPYVWKMVVCGDVAFSSKKWAQYTGNEIIKGEDISEEFSSLPENIVEILKSPCPAFPE